LQQARHGFALRGLSDRKQNSEDEIEAEPRSRQGVFNLRFSDVRKPGNKETIAAARDQGRIQTDTFAQASTTIRSIVFIFVVGSSMRISYSR
jgi:hypothetical protein